MTVKDVQPHAAAQRDMAEHQEGIVGEPVCVIYDCAYSTDTTVQHVLYTDEQVVKTQQYQGKIKSWWYWSDVVDSGEVAGIGAQLQPNKYSILKFVDIHPGVLYVSVSLSYIFVSPTHFAATINKT